jgi:OHCU decarboxylase
MQAASRGGESDAETEARELERLNAEYEAAFPDLRYVYVCLPATRALLSLRKSCLLMGVLCRVFVNGRSRAVIFEDMRARIARGDVGAERLEAIQVGAALRNDDGLRFGELISFQAMCDIASDRALKLA